MSIPDLFGRPCISHALTTSHSSQRRYNEFSIDTPRKMLEALNNTVLRHEDLHTNIPVVLETVNEASYRLFIDAIYIDKLKDSFKKGIVDIHALLRLFPNLQTKLFVANFNSLGEKNFTNYFSHDVDWTQ